MERVGDVCLRLYHVKDKSEIFLKVQ